MSYNTIQYNSQAAQLTTKPVRLGITMLINDKSGLKRNVEQIGCQLAVKISKSLSRFDRLKQTVPYCQTGNREDTASKLSSCPWNNEV